MQKKPVNFNQGNDCDLCRYKIMTGQDGTVESCKRFEFGRDCQYEERDIRVCPVCRNEVDREDMQYTKDCHGVVLRLVCHTCWRRLMSKGYDGEYYEED